jgi:predicted aspartyl protease
MLMRGAVSIMIFALALILVVRAASLNGAARILYSLQNEITGRDRKSAEKNVAGPEARRALSQLPNVVRFREVAGRGLLLDAWINDAGPYVFALDTGAGATIISERVAREARIAIYRNRTTSISGLSGVNNFAGQEASARSIAIGDLNNKLPAKGLVVVTGGLPLDVDGVLDPTEAYAPLGYVIDMPRNEISAFDPRTAPLRIGDVQAGGAIVAWLFDAGSRRPYITLTPGGGRALLDTGSSFGLGVSENAARALAIIVDAGRENISGVQDLGGGTISARRINPATVHIGSLVLQKVPTDLISGANSAAPILLGRDALRPFRLTFDPLNRLIEFAPE